MQVYDFTLNHVKHSINKILLIFPLQNAREFKHANLMLILHFRNWNDFLPSSFQL